MTRFWGIGEEMLTQLSADAHDDDSVAAALAWFQRVRSGSLPAENVSTPFR